MSVLVIGGAGYIGSHAVKALAAADHRPIVYDDFSAGHRPAARFAADVVEGGIQDVAALRRAMKSEAVTAAAVSPRT